MAREDEASTSSQAPPATQRTMDTSRVKDKETFKSLRPKYSRFYQQELPAWKPLMTPGHVIAMLMLVGVVFIPIGALALFASKQIVEVVQPYESVCVSASAVQQNQPHLTTEDKVKFIQDPSMAKNCTVNFTIAKRMKGPVYIYYELSNFYQNHRRYVKSRSDSQLLGLSVKSTDLSSTCAPEDITSEGGDILPCGLIAWSLFNDSYSFVVNNVTVEVNKTNIAWKSDMQKFSGSIRPLNFANNNGSKFVGGGQLAATQPLNKNEDFLVWMRVAAMPRFRKLWGRIDRDLLKGEVVVVNIQNLYNTYSFGGEKKLVLTTINWLGGKNNFIGGAYLVVGLGCVVIAFLFFLLDEFKPRELGDPAYFSWNRKGAESPTQSLD